MAAVERHTPVPSLFTGFVTEPVRPPRRRWGSTSTGGPSLILCDHSAANSNVMTLPGGTSVASPRGITSNTPAMSIPPRGRRVRSENGNRRPSHSAANIALGPACLRDLSPSLHDIGAGSRSASGLLTTLVAAPRHALPPQGVGEDVSSNACAAGHHAQAWRQPRVPSSSGREFPRIPADLHYRGSP
jgi:hypothetical protein